VLARARACARRVRIGDVDHEGPRSIHLQAGAFVMLRLDKPAPMPGAFVVPVIRNEGTVGPWRTSRNGESRSRPSGLSSA
jgi:hypothetical protein